MTSIGDKLALQLPLTAVTQSFEQIIGDAAINAAKAIGGSDTTDESQMLLPSAGIAADNPSGPSTGQVASADFGQQANPSDALLGLRPPSSDTDAASYGTLLQTAQAFGSPDQPHGQGDAPNGVRADGGAGTAPSGNAAAPSSQASAATANTMPTAAASALAIDQKPAGLAEAVGNGSAETGTRSPQAGPRSEGTAALLAELSEPEHAAEDASTAQSSQATPATVQTANAQVTTSVEARFDGSLMATEIIARPGTPQIVAAVVTSNLTTAAMADALHSSDHQMPTRAPDQVQSSDGGDIAAWQVGQQDGGASFAAIDIGAKQSATWSDAQDQSRANTPAEEPTRAAAETNGLDAPRPTQSITTGALVGAVLSSDQSSDLQVQAGVPPFERSVDANLDLKTGITPSGILNAAMIPGWPQQQLVGRMRPEEALAQSDAARGMSDEEMLTYLANLGADDAMLDKVRKALKKPPAGRKITFYLASLATALSVVFKSLSGEVETMMEEDAETAEARKHADARGQKTRRHRLYLE